MPGRSRGAEWRAGPPARVFSGRFGGPARNAAERRRLAMVCGAVLSACAARSTKAARFSARVRREARRRGCGSSELTRVHFWRSRKVYTRGAALLLGLDPGVDESGSGELERPVRCLRIVAVVIWHR